MSTPECAVPLKIPPADHENEKHGRNVQVQLQYLKDLDLYKTVKPLQITPNFADRERRTNIVLSPGEIETITDVRGSDTAFSLDDHGFTYVKDPTMVKDWTSQPTIARDYLPEMERLLRREVGGCDEIIFYDARVRQKGEAGVRVSGLSFNRECTEPPSSVQQT